MKKREVMREKLLPFQSFVDNEVDVLAVVVVVSSVVGESVGAEMEEVTSIKPDGESSISKSDIVVVLDAISGDSE